MPCEDKDGTGMSHNGNFQDPHHMNFSSFSEERAPQIQPAHRQPRYSLIEHSGLQNCIWPCCQNPEDILPVPDGILTHRKTGM